ncbi:MAG: hypothetical protein RL141_533 [Candidatus Parcubacteria bacterium]|jgi:hypothetical protein
MTHPRLFAIAWRAALILLPWQTRLILSTPQLNGFPWEQGTVAMYVSWIPLVLTIVLSWSDLKAHAARVSLRAIVVMPIVALALTSLFTASWTATLLWWVHVLMLGLFAASLVVHRIPSIKIIAWFIYALIPHVALGLWQFASQHVFGSTLLGMAEQISSNSGVSVVEYGEYRTLRAYGGFPHPNVFGGWLAVALVLLPPLIRDARSTLIKFSWITCGALFAYTLILTFSRGAWIAAAIGLPLAFVVSFRHAVDHKQREAVISAIVLFLAALGIGLFTQWDAVSSRFIATERLEQWSLSQRTSAIADGFVAWKSHPIVGWGSGASLIGIAVARTAPSPVPLEPPHLVPFVILLETGIVGLLAMLGLGWFVLRTLIREQRLMNASPLLIAIACLALTDHYLWTLWVGSGLLCVVGMLTFQKR